MLFSEICPYVRYARYITVLNKDVFYEKIPYDSRLFYATAGEGAIRVGNVLYKMSRGDLLVIDAGTPYRIETPKNEVSFAILNFDYTKPPEDKLLPIPPAATPAFSPEKMIFCTFEDGGISPFFLRTAHQFEGWIDGIIKEFSKRLVYFDAKISAVLAVLLFEIKRKSVSMSQNGTRDSRLDEILRYIDLHFAEQLTNSTVAEHFSFHPNYVGEIIKRGTGMTLHKYLIHVRLLRALDMLDGGVESISSVSERCGFFDTAHFSRAFKKNFGASPKRYFNK